MNTSPDHHAISQFQQQVIAEFRASSGKVGGMFAGADLLLLTTTGARTGKSHTNPLAYFIIDHQLAVVASAAGAPAHPHWYHNIRRNPAVTVEIGDQSYPALAAILPAQQRDDAFSQIIMAAPGFAEYQAKTTRLLPVLTLHAANTSVGGLGDFIVESHDWLRRELAILREQFQELAVTAEAGGTAGERPGLRQQLHEHCRTFCGALDRHHTGEGQGAFPMLAQRFPGLRTTLDRLGAEHQRISAQHRELTRLIDRYEPGKTSPQQILNELDALSTSLLAHFAAEEQEIVAALNALGPAPAPLPAA